jgi:sulfatase modifying factor 1
MERIGDYDLIEKIGSGGMGEVWLGENVHTGLRYAVKLLPQEATRDRNFVARFFDEGRLMAQLEHPHIVRVHHVGHDERSGRHYLVMDYVEGPEGKPQSLHEVLALSPDNRLSPMKTLAWATQVVEALAFAHGQHVVHRDIKPANILIDKEGNARITDFGLAKAIGEEFVRTQIHQSIQLSMHGTLSDIPTQRFSPGDVGEAERSLGDQKTISPDDSKASHRTTAESLLGTYDYMSPEQRGELPGVEVGPASDVYSFGVMLYRMLTGRRPSGMAEPPSQLVEGLSTKWDVIVAHCLKHQPNDRYANGAELLAALEGVSRCGSGFTRLAKAGVWIAILTCVVIGGYVGWTRLQTPSRRQAQPVTPVIIPEQAPSNVAKVPFQIEVEPVGASVTLTHDRLGLVAEQKVSGKGLDVQLAPGTYHALVTADGYRTVQQDIEVSESKPLWQVKLSERRGELVVTSNPGVSVSALGPDGKAMPLGTTDAQGHLTVTTLREGDYTLNLGLADYRGETVRVSLIEGRQVEAKKVLEPMLGKLKIGGRNEMEVYEATRRLGKANDWIELPAGTHDLELRCKGFRTERIQVMIPPNRPVVQQSPTLVAQSGSIRIIASSAAESDDYLPKQKAQVRIDTGQWREVTLPYIEEGLSCESHQVELKIAGYGRPSVKQVTVKDAQVSPAEFSLTPDEGTVTITSNASETEVFDASGKKLGSIDRPGVDANSQQVVLEEIRGPVVGEAWTVPDLNMILVYVEPGSFQMGSNNGNGNEKPAHIVRISQPFWMGKYEVTNEQYRRFVEESRYDGSREADSDYLRHRRDWSHYLSPQVNYPTVCVSWNNALAFCRWLTESERNAGRLPDRYVYRLPTEAEWEYAARGGTKSRGFRYAGSNNPNEIGWYPDRWGHITQPVGQKKPNELGLYDMSGNAWEWCHDWYAGDYYGKSPSSDPTGPSFGNGRVLRGGSWERIYANPRATNREKLRWYSGRDIFGFRVVVSFPLDASSTPSLSDESVHEPGKSSQEVQKIHALQSDLVEIPDAQYAVLNGLAPGSREAQDRQRETVQRLGLPLEVKTAKTGIVFRLIPAGGFMMGSPYSERGRDSDETQHEAVLTEPFYCGKYEVTQGQWEAVMGNNPSDFRNGGRDTPVEQVSWEDCQAFLKKLCEIEGVAEGTYRLLTEAEWEYACRVGTQTVFCYGNDIDASMANFDGDFPYGNGCKGQDRRATIKVGSFQPNGWGLYDVHGNVWEWCEDWFGEYVPGSVTDPLGSPSGGNHVSRGGGWNFSAVYCRSADRYGGAPDYRGTMGLRLATTTPARP